MYTSWEALLIRSEKDLQDTVRLKKVLKARGSMLFMIWMFSLAAMICFGLSFLFVYLGWRQELRLAESAGSAVALFLVGGSFVFATKLAKQERDMNLLRRYLLNAGDFDFAPCALESFSYSAGQSRRSDRIIVEGKAIAKSGEELLVMEVFSPSIWPFTTVENDAQLREGDDMYSLKGKRAVLPLQGHCLYEKRNPGIAVLVGVDESVIRTALKKAGIS